MFKFVAIMNMLKMFHHCMISWARFIILWSRSRGWRWYLYYSKSERRQWWCCGINNQVRCLASSDGDLFNINNIDEDTLLSNTHNWKRNMQAWYWFLIVIQQLGLSGNIMHGVHITNTYASMTNIDVRDIGSATC